MAQIMAPRSGDYFLAIKTVLTSYNHPLILSIIFVITLVAAFFFANHFLNKKNLVSLLISVVVAAITTLTAIYLLVANYLSRLRF